MSIPITLSLKGVQKYPENEPEVIELVTDGTLGHKNNLWSIRYEESALTGLEGVTTMFMISEDEIVLRRTGKLNSEMRFKEGVPHDSLYQMEFGALVITVHPKKVAVNLTEEGGTVDLTYGIDIEQTTGGEIEYHLVVKKK